jgi:hypothetical protein
MIQLYDQRCTTEGLRKLYHAVGCATKPWTKHTTLSRDGLQPPTWITAQINTEISNRLASCATDGDVSSAPMGAGSGMAAGIPVAVAAAAEAANVAPPPPLRSAAVHDALAAPASQRDLGLGDAAVVGGVLLSQPRSGPGADPAFISHKRRLPNIGEHLRAQEVQAMKRHHGAVAMTCSACKQRGHSRASPLCPMRSSTGMSASQPAPSPTRKPGPPMRGMV